MTAKENKTNLETAKRVQELAAKHIESVMAGLAHDMKKFEQELNRLADDSEKQLEKAEVNTSVSDAECDRLEDEASSIRDMADGIEDWKEGL